MQRPVGHAIPVLAAALTAALTLASCSSAVPAPQASAGGRPSRGASASPPGQAGSPPGQAGSPPASGQPGTPAPASPSGGPSPPLPPSPPSGCDDSRWLIAPVNVERAVAAPPVPVVTEIRMGTHPDCGYDRLVLNIRGPAPAYEVKYVTKSAAGQAAETIATSGDRYLLLTLHPAQGHRQSGESTISPVGAVAFPVLRGYSVASDFEGALCIVVVVARATAFRVGELSGRLFIDVAG
jgi:hypothetical protein